MSGLPASARALCSLALCHSICKPGRVLAGAADDAAEPACESEPEPDPALAPPAEAADAEVIAAGTAGAVTLRVVGSSRAGMSSSSSSAVEAAAADADEDAAAAADARAPAERDEEPLAAGAADADEDPAPAAGCFCSGFHAFISRSYRMRSASASRSKLATTS
jgi:hypothetical protein